MGPPMIGLGMSYDSSNFSQSAQYMLSRQTERTEDILNEA